MMVMVRHIHSSANTLAKQLVLPLGRQRLEQDLRLCGNMVMHSWVVNIIDGGTTAHFLYQTELSLRLSNPVGNERQQIQFHHVFFATMR